MIHRYQADRCECDPVRRPAKLEFALDHGCGTGSQSRTCGHCTSQPAATVGHLRPTKPGMFRFEASVSRSSGRERRRGRPLNCFPFGRAQAELEFKSRFTLGPATEKALWESPSEGRLDLTGRRP